MTGIAKYLKAGTTVTRFNEVKELPHDAVVGFDGEQPVRTWRGRSNGDLDGGYLFVTGQVKGKQETFGVGVADLMAAPEPDSSKATVKMSYLELAKQYQAKAGKK